MLNELGGRNNQEVGGQVEDGCHHQVGNVY